MSAETSKYSRNPALDFTKGALVLIMVLYHWMNYFYGPHDSRYLRFLTPSFIFITGFLISFVYLSKYQVTGTKLPKRLLQRGGKILGVFVLLNIVRIPLVFGSFYTKQDPSEMSPIKSLFDVYVIGSGVGGGQSKAVAFFILIPIGYLLILSALLTFAYKIYPHAFHITCLFFLLCIVAMAIQGMQSPNLELVTIGLMGVVCGFLSSNRVENSLRRPFILGALYILYLVAITVWNAIYPLQIVGVLLSLMILYAIGQTEGQPGFIKSIIILLGKYSLFGYISQIAILQVLRRSLIYLDQESLVLFFSFGLAIALTILSVEALDWVRLRVPSVDKVYGAVFS